MHAYTYVQIIFAIHTLTPAAPCGPSGPLLPGAPVGPRSPGRPGSPSSPCYNGNTQNVTPKLHNIINQHLCCNYHGFVITQMKVKSMLIHKIHKYNIHWYHTLSWICNLLMNY